MKRTDQQCNRRWNIIYKIAF